MAGDFVGAPVVYDPPVPKDGSKPPDDKKPDDKKQGQLVPASAFQSMSEELPWVVTERAIEQVLSRERNYNRALADKNPSAERLWKWTKALALGRLEAAVNREMTTMVGPDATRDQLELVRKELVDRAEGTDAKSIVGETARQVASYRIAAAADTAIAASRYPYLPLKKKEADFHKALQQLDAAATSFPDGNAVVTQRFTELQAAAMARRAAWFSARRDADTGQDTALQEACKLRLERADLAVKRVNAPGFILNRAIDRLNFSFEP